MRMHHKLYKSADGMFIFGWMEWTGVCRWELIQENDHTRKSEIQNTTKSSQGKFRLTNVVYARQCEFKKYQGSYSDHGENHSTKAPCDFVHSKQ